MDIYLEYGGTVLKWLCEDLDVVPMMTGVCIISTAGEDISANPAPVLAQRAPIDGRRIGALQCNKRKRCSRGGPHE